MSPLSLSARSQSTEAIPAPVLAVFRGIGQVFFQENALTGLCFVLGIALSSPVMAAGAVAGAVIGLGTARLLSFDAEEAAAGIFGFNAALVGIATFFFFQPNVSSLVLLLVGGVAATLLTRVFRTSLPFPTYTSPFVLMAWVLFLIGPSLGAVPVGPGDPAVAGSVVRAVANGISQVMFQANIGTAVLFLLGISLNNWRHGVWVLVASAMGVLAANYHVTPEMRALDPERLIQRFLIENITLGLYSYNATLAALALFIWRRSLIPPVLGILISVPLTEFVPMLGVPALTAPFILATWSVLVLGWFDGRFLPGPGVPATETYVREHPPAAETETT
ncbi:urea transporter [Tautonia marina]|uniref:urea transporter n=1 Tax=Tautonia marina TaxID=2653855 RepID=UPI00126139C4|nr:urea transporter [Tautonia marina]